jgi:thiamine-phosphate pyrophosphorylase
MESIADNFDLLLARIGAAASAGIDWIQIREKDLGGRECSRLTSEALAQIKKSASAGGKTSKLLINDRLDIALSQHADGVHLGEHSLPLGQVRSWLNTRPSRTDAQNFLVGVSCHSMEEAVNAARDGADYIFFGPVFDTPSKAVFGAPQGLGRLAEVCQSAAIPVLAIGGITLAPAADCIAAGAAGIAAIRLFQDAEDIATLVAQLHGIRR